ncbi:MAG: lantibiotic epidermin [Parachlamydia sp.]|jgi:gallidermin/nisin family lantibiotic|nr:MAG: lantibiotic epidermin [Parachlamydia sp.]
MKIDPSINLFSLTKTIDKDVFDLDVKLSKQATDDKVVNQLITSKSLCTPGCPNGTMHSFCC